MKTVLILLVMAMVSFLSKAEEIRIDEDITVREPISSIRYVSGAE